MQKIYDIIGIGIGPFNLGLAALTHEIQELSCIFFDQAPSFNWHPGLLLETARLQVPFYADLVTLADPTNKFSYLNFLHAKQRMIPFGIHQKPFPSRIEYNLYCQWAAKQMDNLHFNCCCTNITYNPSEKIYTVEINDTLAKEQIHYQSRNIVIGVGTIPHLPDAVKNIHHGSVIHSSEYLDKKRKLLTKNRIAVIGAGQSAAEIFDDLLSHTNNLDQLSWFTRSTFSPMDYSAFALEMASPDYINYFHPLSDKQKQITLSKQNHLYKAINADLLGQIYDKLYMQNIIGERNIARLYPNADLQSVLVRPRGILHLEFAHIERHETFTRDTDALILATGYKYTVPSFLNGMKDHIQWTPQGYYNVNKNYSIDKPGTSCYVQNADLYSHGFNSADLGLGPYRNAIILNTILGQQRFAVESDSTFQMFNIATYQSSS